MATSSYHINKQRPDIKLVEARAELAELKKLPSSAFRVDFSRSGSILRHSVDNQRDAIKQQEAKVAKLEILSQPTYTLAVIERYLDLYYAPVPGDLREKLNQIKEDQNNANNNN